MHTFIENYLHFMKNCIRPHYEKLKPLKSGFIENSNFENNRDPWSLVLKTFMFWFKTKWGNVYFSTFTTVLGWSEKIQKGEAFKIYQRGFARTNFGLPSPIVNRNQTEHVHVRI